jgi:kelch repeat/BTB domain-containing protein 3
MEFAMDNSYDFNEESSCNGISSEKRNNFLVSEDHGQKILSILQSFREQNVFYDFKIILNDEIIPCHRCVLAACSDFFRYFTSSLFLILWHG